MSEAGYERLPFDQAIAFFKDKLAIPSDRWDVLWGDIVDHAFTIAGVTKAEILNDIHQEILKALEEGTTLQQFKKDFDNIAAKRGWSEGEKFSSWRKELIFSMNLRTAYAAGRYQQMTDPSVTAARPHWQWRHRDSKNPRPAHLALNGKVFSFDDPFWKTGFPPCGFGCRCAAFSLSDRDLEKRGLKVEPSPTETATIRDRITGKTQKVPAINGQPIAEPGFAHAPGSSRKEQKQESVDRALDRLPPKLRSLVSASIDLSEVDFARQTYMRDSAGRFAKTGVIPAQNIPQSIRADKRLADATAHLDRDIQEYAKGYLSKIDSRDPDWHQKLDRLKELGDSDYLGGGILAGRDGLKTDQISSEHLSIVQQLRDKYTDTYSQASEFGKEALHRSLKSESLIDDEIEGFLARKEQDLKADYDRADQQIADYVRSESTAIRDRFVADPTNAALERKFERLERMTDMVTGMIHADDDDSSKWADLKGIERKPNKLVAPIAEDVAFLTRHGTPGTREDFLAGLDKHVVTIADELYQVSQTPETLQWREKFPNFREKSGRN